MLKDQLGVLAPVRSVLGQFTHGQGCTVTLKGLSVSGGYAAREISLTAGNSTEEGRRCDWPDGLLQSLQASL